MHPNALTAPQRLLQSLRDRGLVDGNESRWGQPALRQIECGQEPQRLMDATTLQRHLVECAHARPSMGDDLCAGWVRSVFCTLGICDVVGDARTLYESYCNRGQTRDLKVGMIVATPAAPYSTQARVHGHVGLYVGDNQVMDAVANEVRTVDIELWLSTYGLMAQPRWGWLGSIDLSRL